VVPIFVPIDAKLPLSYSCQSPQMFSAPNEGYKTMPQLTRYASLLDALAKRNRRRILRPGDGLDFSSNDYLGLANSPWLKQAAMEALECGVPAGSGGSRLLRGNHPEHAALEEEAAAFFGAEAALFMGGGFQANQAVFSSLPAGDDLVIYDEFIHASVHEGMRLGRARTAAFAHNAVDHARKIARRWREEGGRGTLWIAVESLYSMEGDFAPLAELAALATETDALLIVDEAHATGVFGPQGRGLAHGLIDLPHISIHTCGKALGIAGGLILAPRVLIDTLINRARPFIFATSPPPLTAALVRASLRLLQAKPELQEVAIARISHAHREAARTCGLSGFESQVMPVILGEDKTAMRHAAALQAAGFDVRGIRPPTVPRGTARLRISITGNVDNQAITGLFETLGRQLQEDAG